MTYEFDFIGKSVFPIALYVGPTREYYSEYEKTEVKSLITDKVFKELSEMGVNVILGHHAEFEGHNERLKILEYCTKYKMVYLPRYDADAFGYYDSELQKTLTYSEFSEQEQESAKQKFIDFINLYKDYPAFGGIFGGDEPGIDLVPAYVEMKKIFDSVCPDKLFYVNMFGPDSEKQIWLKYGGVHLSNKESNELSSPDTLTWFDVIYNYANTVGLEVMSLDNYIFYKNAIRPVLLRDIDRLRRGCYHDKTLWYFVLDGQEGEFLTGQTKAETFYQSNLAIAAGVSGLCLYPGFSPIECSNTLQRAIYDRKTGEKAEYYFWYKELFTHIHKCEKVLMNSSYKGLIKTGVNGGEISTEKLVQLEEHLEKQGTGDSVVHTSALLNSFGELVGVYSTKSQVVLGCYKYGEKYAVYLVNNSASINTEVKLKFRNAVKISVVDGGKEFEYDNILTIDTILSAGEGVLYVFG